jgi:predicted dithiol-disulfide oxidoreductase (DUF899 family)
MDPPRIATRAEWLDARTRLLAREKELTHLRDRVAAERRALPWVRIEKPYAFEGPNGRVTLGDLFEGRSQLVLQHFMFGPGWREGCVGCSFAADHVDAARRHFEHNDLSFTAVSRAPYAELAPFQRRMGWRFAWVSSFGSDFNYDFAVSFTELDRARGKAVYNFELRDYQNDELPGTSVFARNAAGAIFHTYSAYGRGDEQLIGAYHYLDLAPKGRNENGPNFDMTDWVRHHDRYAAGGTVDATGRYRPAEDAACCADPSPSRAEDGSLRSG